MPIFAATRIQDGLTVDNSLKFPGVGKPLLRGTLLFWVLQAGGWIAFGAVMYVWGLSYWSPIDALVNKGLLVTTGFLLTLAFRSIYRAVRKRGLQPLASAVLIGAVSFCGAALWRESQTILFQVCSRTSVGGTGVVQLSAISLGTWLYDGFVLLAW